MEDRIARLEQGLSDAHGRITAVSLATIKIEAEQTASQQMRTTLVKRYDEQIKKIDETIEKHGETLYGNGQVGLTTKVDAVEKSVKSLGTELDTKMEALSSAIKNQKWTLVTVVGIVTAVTQVVLHFI